MAYDALAAPFDSQEAIVDAVKSNPIPKPWFPHPLMTSTAFVPRWSKRNIAPARGM